MFHQLLTHVKWIIHRLVKKKSKTSVYFLRPKRLKITDLIYGLEWSLLRSLFCSTLSLHSTLTRTGEPTHLRNIKRAPCLHRLMQTQEGVWENSKVCVNTNLDLHKLRLSSSPKLPRVFASGYVNTASVLYFFYEIYDKDSASCVYIAWCKQR